MEKKKINKEKKKRNNLPIIMALCAVIGTTCSVLALTQDFNLDSIFESPSSSYNVLIAPENVHDCTLLPATTTSVFQAENGDIEISTDGHIQVPLFDSNYEKIIPQQETVFTLNCNLNIKTDGYIGFTFPYECYVGDSSNSVNRPSIFIKNSGGVIGLYYVQTNHLCDSYGKMLDCFSEDKLLAYSDLSDITDLSNIKLKFLFTNNYVYVSINGRNVEWFKINDNVSLVYSGTSLYFSRGTSAKSSRPIVIDAYNISANINNLSFEIYR